MPCSPKREAIQPSFICPLVNRLGTSQWSMMGTPSAEEYSRACLINMSFAIGCPSSEKATAPTSTISAISVSSFPSLFFVAEPIGSTRAGCTLALSSRNCIEVASSVTGSVFGMAQMVVKPPLIAAAEPDFTVSLCSKPGSLRWQWRSINPGANIRPEASIVITFSVTFKFNPISFIFSDSSKISMVESILFAGHSTLAPFIRSLLVIYHPRWLKLLRITRPFVQQHHLLLDLVLRNGAHVRFPCQFLFPRL